MRGGAGKDPKSRIEDDRATWVEFFTVLILCMNFYLEGDFVRFFNHARKKSLCSWSRDDKGQ